MHVLSKESGEGLAWDALLSEQEAIARDAQQADPE